MGFLKTITSKLLGSRKQKITIVTQYPGDDSLVFKLNILVAVKPTPDGGLVIYTDRFSMVSDGPRAKVFMDETKVDTIKAAAATIMIAAGQSIMALPPESLKRDEVKPNPIIQAIFKPDPKNLN